MIGAGVVLILDGVMKQFRSIIAVLGAPALLLFGSHLYAQTVPTDGLVGFWAGNGNADDTSTNGNNGTFPGTYAPSPWGEAFQVDGASSYVSIPAINAYNFTTAFSVDFWFYGTPSEYTTFLGQDDGGGSVDKWFVGYEAFGPNEDFDLHENGSNFAIIETNPVIPSSGEWNNLALVDNSGNFTFYLDGSEISSTANDGTFPEPSAPFTIGYAESGYGFSGLIGNVALYNTALTSGEVKQLYSVPEPSTWAMLAAGVGSVICFWQSSRMNKVSQRTRPSVR